ncbi:MAG TPA: hypothetical protein VGL58_08580 [Caulobacteraceae bacterium]
MNRVFAIVCAALVAACAVAIPFLAPAQTTPSWRGDVCHEPAAARIACEAYPLRIQAHQSNCKWVHTQDSAGAHAFEVCRDPDHIWRPSGRS